MGLIGDILVLYQYIAPLGLKPSQKRLPNRRKKQGMLPNLLYRCLENIGAKADVVYTKFLAVE
jgi:hypothetical protein